MYRGADEVPALSLEDVIQEETQVVLQHLRDIETSLREGTSAPPRYPN